MNLLKNLGLFLLVFLPAVALASMALEGILGAPSPTWQVGWNPLLWLLWTAPWHLPLVILVPVLQLLARWFAKRASGRRLRGAVLGASPLLFALSMWGIWGPGNGGLEVLMPVVMAALAYGSVLRLPGPLPAPALAQLGARQG